MNQKVSLYVDFISPYSWLALLDIGRLVGRQSVDLSLKPVVFSALLDASGLVGPAESATKRPNAILDAMRCATVMGRQLVGPPQHPFRTIEALRCAHLIPNEDGQRLRLCRALSDATWGEGRDLTDLNVISAILKREGFSTENLKQRLVTPENKLRLREATEAAIEAGIFGVPTYAYEGELFWGHDRLDHLLRRLDGEARPDAERLREILERPRALDRKR
jgi:2-hydroxychromene-2-carboxylate isomerase